MSHRAITAPTAEVIEQKLRDLDLLPDPLAPVVVHDGDVLWLGPVVGPLTLGMRCVRPVAEGYAVIDEEGEILID